ncbi:MAG: RHS repeat-associated core domain-containing protein, partial [Lysobacteraceae bacterium]
HMNGRIYEPRLGRFLQPDPFVQEPGNLQNHNRYTYVWNNPLNATDPSGYLGVRERQWLGVAVAVVGAVAGQYWISEMGLSIAAANTAAVVYGAGLGAVSGGISTQSTSGALWGAFSGMAFAGAGNYIRDAGWSQGSWQAAATHAGVGGVLSHMQGGKFGHAFVSAGLSKYQMGNHVTAEGMTGGLQAALIGGTVSRLTGGKFANGAATAALQFAVNQAMSGTSQSRARSYARERTEYLNAEYAGKSGAHDHDVLTRVCETSTAGCTPNYVGRHLQVESVPGIIGIPQEGEMTLLGSGIPGVPGFSRHNRIVHFQAQENMWVNETLEGHDFHKGRVVNFAFEHGGGVYIYTRGVGVGPHASVNFVVGQTWAYLTHGKVSTRANIGIGPIRLDK